MDFDFDRFHRKSGVQATGPLPARLSVESVKCTNENLSLKTAAAVINTRIFICLLRGKWTQSFCSIPTWWMSFDRVWRASSKPRPVITLNEGIKLNAYRTDCPGALLHSALAFQKKKREGFIPEWHWFTELRRMCRITWGILISCTNQLQKQCRPRITQVFLNHQTKDENCRQESFTPLHPDST